MYVLGYTGSKELLIMITNKLTELFGDIPKEVLTKAFNDFITGERTFKFQIGIIDITKALRELGLKTFEDKEREELAAKLRENY